MKMPNKYIFHARVPTAFLKPRSDRFTATMNQRYLTLSIARTIADLYQKRMPTSHIPKCHLSALYLTSHTGPSESDAHVLLEVLYTANPS